jgi:hypothetical protein
MVRYQAVSLRHGDDVRIDVVGVRELASAMRAARLGRVKAKSAVELLRKEMICCISATD